MSSRPVDELDFLETPEESWAEAYSELMGDDDEVDVFFILPRHEPPPVTLDLDMEESLLVLRVMGLPDDAYAWVH